MCVCSLAQIQQSFLSPQTTKTDTPKPTMGLLKLRNPSELLQQPQQGETDEIADSTADQNITIKLEVVDSEDDSEEDEAEAADLAAAQAQLEERKSTDEMEEDFLDALASFEDDIKEEEEEGQGNDDIGVDPTVSAVSPPSSLLRSPPPVAAKTSPAPSLLPPSTSSLLPTPSVQAREETSSPASSVSSGSSSSKNKRFRCWKCLNYYHKEELRSHSCLPKLLNDSLMCCVYSGACFSDKEAIRAHTKACKGFGLEPLSELLTVAASASPASFTGASPSNGSRLR